MTTSSRSPLSRLLGAVLVLLLWSSCAASEDAGRQTGSTGAGGSRSHEEQSVRDAEARWVAALQKRDGAALRSLLDENFVDITWRGEVRDREAAVAALEAPGRPSATQTLQDLRVRFAAADVAVVTGVNVVASEAPAFNARVRFTDVFVKRVGAWMALSAQETLEQHAEARR
jgi:ketosteroid isomerase-like protein